MLDATCCLPVFQAEGEPNIASLTIGNIMSSESLSTKHTNVSRRKGPPGSKTNARPTEPHYVPQNVSALELTGHKFS